MSNVQDLLTAEQKSGECRRHVSVSPGFVGETRVEYVVVVSLLAVLGAGQLDWFATLSRDPVACPPEKDGQQQVRTRGSRGGCFGFVHRMTSKNRFGRLTVVIFRGVAAFLTTYPR